MAARRVKIRHDEETRLRIKAAKIIDRIQADIDGEIELRPSQVTGALGLLRKVLPDLNTVDVSGDVTNTWVVEIPGLSPNDDTWQQQHTPKPLIQ